MKVQKSLLHISDTRFHCTFKLRLFVYMVLILPANECKAVVSLELLCFSRYKNAHMQNIAQSKSLLVLWGLSTFLFLYLSPCHKPLIHATHNTLHYHVSKTVCQMPNETEGLFV